MVRSIAPKHSNVYGMAISVKNYKTYAHKLTLCNSNGLQTICIYVADLKIVNTCYTTHNRKWNTDTLKLYKHLTCCTFIIH